MNLGDIIVNGFSVVFIIWFLAVGLLLNAAYY